MHTKTLARNTLIGFVVLALVYFVLYNWYDIPSMYFIYIALSTSILTPISEAISVIFAPECWIILAVVITAYAFFHHKKIPAKHCESLLRFGLTIIATSIVLTILKIAFGRYRPEMLFTDDLYGFHFMSFSHNSQSTPSGHATMAFCGFYSIARLTKKAWLTPILLLIAALICIAKLILADHYLSDVLFGGYLGVVSVLWMEVILNHTKAKWCPHAKIN